MLKPLIVLISLFITACSTTPVTPSRKPGIIKQVKPNYPVYAYRNHITGFVKFDYDVGADGKVSEMRIRESEPQHLFDEVVIAAMAQWRFEINKPYKNLHQKITFTLNGGNDLIPGTLK
ncbi:TonB family protein [Erwinia sp. MMLR14_017]|uniref:TonB family protein n=1 Tax=Erwinia sp. MMLR14_017 TaxID=3093842 RepID=UPI00298FF2C5|nr:TonB family protein [Erwinia sp. MMLR14_017]MDW8848293.1 TonB family protein [Erwinia sp. MMLR14_017]